MTSKFNPKVVAVYGTLRFGGAANGLLRDAEYLGQDTILGRMYNLGSYPGLHLCKEAEAKKIVVDLYEVKDEDTLADLDNYEGYNKFDEDRSLYLRKETQAEGGLTVSVYEYNANCINMKEVETGDWFDR